MPRDLSALVERATADPAAADPAAADPAAADPAAADTAVPESTRPVSRPTTLLAEITYRCPLHCPYCSNPLDLARAQAELTTAEWQRVFTEARALGVLQLGLSGGEPLLRKDLEDLATHAHRAGLYTTLVTSGLGLTRDRAYRLRDAGIDHVQISFQDADPKNAEHIAGIVSVDKKLAAAALVRELGLAFTVNVVLHRGNLDRISEIIDFAASLGADRLELANTQYYGWAAINRDTLMPTRAQLAAAEQVVEAAVVRHRGRMQIIYVLPDYYSEFPKPCYGGWGAVYIVIAPDGTVLPCHAASQITSLSFASVRERSLQWIWEDSPGFRAFRGESWMREPCRTCPRRTIDFGGCRCQAFLLTGDARQADPVCTKSPHRHLIDEVLSGAAETTDPPPYTYRVMAKTGTSSRRPRASVGD